MVEFCIYREYKWRRSLCFSSFNTWSVWSLKLFWSLYESCCCELNLLLNETWMFFLFLCSLMKTLFKHDRNSFPSVFPPPDFSPQSDSVTDFMTQWSFLAFLRPIIFNLQPVCCSHVIAGFCFGTFALMPALQTALKVLQTPTKWSFI